MTKLQDILSIKLQGTNLDRRSKHKDKEAIINLYNNRKKYNIKVKDIAKQFGLSQSQVYRYAHYDRYLENCRNNSKNYNHRLGKEIISAKNKIQHKKLVDYKNKLYLEQ